MSLSNGLYRLAAATALINAVIHLTGAALAGFASAPISMYAGTVLWLIFAAGLMANKRLIAYFAFLLSLVSAILMYTQLGTASALPHWVIITITLLHLAIALILFVLLWRRQ